MREEQALLERLHAVLLAMDEADQVIVFCFRFSLVDWVIGGAGRGARRAVDWAPAAPLHEPSRAFSPPPL